MSLIPCPPLPQASSKKEQPPALYQPGMTPTQPAQPTQSSFGAEKSAAFSAENFAARSIGAGAGAGAAGGAPTFLLPARSLARSLAGRAGAAVQGRLC